MGTAREIIRGRIGGMLDEVESRGTGSSSPPATKSGAALGSPRSRLPEQGERAARREEHAQGLGVASR